jgi:hypothetical protein
MRDSPAKSVLLAMMIVVAVCATGGWAQEQRVGDAMFTPPKDWKLVRQADGVMRMLSPDGNGMLIVMGGDRFPGDLKEGFDVTWEGLLQGLDLRSVDKAVAPEAGQTVGFESVSLRSSLVDRQRNRITGRYALLRNGEAVVGVAVVSSEKTFAEHESRYEQLLQSLTLGGERARADGVSPGPARDAPGEMEAGRLGQPREDAGKPRAARKAAAPPDATPGTIAGVVTDAHGNVPHGRITIALSGTTIRGGERTSFEIPVDEQTGAYAMQVPDGLYTAWAFLETEYNGRRYRLQLSPTDDSGRHTQFATQKGLVRNFVWRISGLEPGADERLATAYYGGKVTLWDEKGFREGERLGDRYPGGEVVVRLEPDGRLIDGSEGKPVVLRARTAELRDTPEFPDVPLGRYTATAILAHQGRELQLELSPRRMGSGEAPADFSRSATIEFVQPSVFESISTVQVLLRG